MLITPSEAGPPRHGARPRREATGDGVFRRELHGLRGLALSLVVLFHLFGNGRVSGGIDVFLAITGFLFTGSLLRRARRGKGRISLVDHFGRLGQRLLPPVLPVLLAVAAGTYLLLPSSRWVQTARELKATILYYENWELIGSQLDYTAAGADTSPLQHFWSLSVQGQFHLVAPFVVMAVVMLALRCKTSPRFALIGVLGAAFIGSMAYSVYLTSVDQPVAYFHSGARMWEFALGGLAALLLPHLKLTMRARAVSGWVGVAMIVSCGLIFDGGRLFPGYAALWPVVGLILVLAGGMTTSPWGVDRLLVTRPFTFAADISYSLYLWHWPILVFFLAATGRSHVKGTEALGILAVAVLLAWLSKRCIEDPAQRWSRGAGARRKFAVAVASVALVAGSTGATASNLADRQEALLARTLTADGDHPGAAAMFAPDAIDRRVLDADEVLPDPSVVAEDLPDVYQQECIQDGGDTAVEVLSCTNGIDDDPAQRIVLTGGSHVVQWWPALDALAQQHDWQLTLITKNACHLTTDRGDLAGPEMTEACHQWNDEAMDVIRQLRPTAVFTLGSTTLDGEQTSAGMIGAWNQLAEDGIQVIAVRDTPRLEVDPAECFTRSGIDPVECGQPRDGSLRDTFPLLTAEGVPETVTPLDLTEAFCTDEVCPAVIGKTIVMRDDNHVGATYMRSITPFLELHLKDAAPGLFEGRAG